MSEPIPTPDHMNARLSLDTDGHVQTQKILPQAADVPTLVQHNEFSEIQPRYAADGLYIPRPNILIHPKKIGRVVLVL